MAFRKPIPTEPQLIALDGTLLMPRALTVYPGPDPARYEALARGRIEWLTEYNYSADDWVRVLAASQRAHDSISSLDRAWFASLLRHGTVATERAEAQSRRKGQPSLG